MFIALAGVNNAGELCFIVYNDTGEATTASNNSFPAGVDDTVDASLSHVSHSFTVLSLVKIASSVFLSPMSHFNAQLSLDFFEKV